jgi:hypothetical protein
MFYHAVGVAVGELNGEGFEGVAFGDIMFDSFLELFACEASSTYNKSDYIKIYLPMRSYS